MDAAQFLEQLTRDAGPVVLTGHESPDGDCLGSQVGLAVLLRELGVSTRVVLPDPLPPALQFLCDGDGAPPVEVYSAERGLGACGTLVLLDCCQVSRLGPLRAAVEAAAPRIAVVDHHVGAAGEVADAHFVDSDAAATGEMVARLWDAAGRAPDPVAAQALFVALVADTGWFRYSNTGAAVFERAAALAAAGVDAAAVYDRLHRRNHPGSVPFLARAIGRSRILHGGRIGILTLDTRSVAEANRLGVELDLLMEPLRSVAGMEVVTMVKPAPQNNGRVKVSLRAQGDVDVQRIAAHFGGGGHRKAAGATFHDVSVDDVVARVTASIVAALDGGTGSATA